MNQQNRAVSSQTTPHIWAPSTIEDQIRGIEDLMTSSSWLLLTPLQKKNWRRQLNGLRCRYIFHSAYTDRTSGGTAVTLNRGLPQTLGC